MIHERRNVLKNLKFYVPLKALVGELLTDPAAVLVGPAVTLRRGIRPGIGLSYTEFS